VLIGKHDHHTGYQSHPCTALELIRTVFVYPLVAIPGIITIAEQYLTGIIYYLCVDWGSL